MQPEPSSTTVAAATAARIAADLAGDRSRREAAYDALTALINDGPGGRADDSAFDIAVACVAPLIDNVFGAGLSVVGAEEYQRANLLLNNLFLLRERPRRFYPCVATLAALLPYCGVSLSG
jgi:hypothetical protein